MILSDEVKIKYINHKPIGTMAVSTLIKSGVDVRDYAVVGKRVESVSCSVVVSAVLHPSFPHSPEFILGVIVISIVVVGLSELSGRGIDSSKCVVGFTSSQVW